MLSTRFVLIIGGLVTAYFVAYAGDGLYVLAVAEMALPKDQWGWIYASISVGFVAAIAGGLLYYYAMGDLLGIPTDPNHVSAGTVAFAMAGFIWSSCLFGILAGPFANHGMYPLNWMNRWSWIPILAFIPVALAIRDVFLSIMALRREKKITKDSNVAPLRRDSA